MVGFSYLQWAATVVVPLLGIIVPVLLGLRRQVRALDQRNTEQHNVNTSVSSERFDRLEDRLDLVLTVASDTNRQMAEHLRDHFKGAA